MGFIIDETPYAGGKESERVFCVCANNPSPMTYTGTNTWVLAEAASPECIVIDPAPAGEHVQNVLNACIEQGLRVGAVVCTHMLAVIRKVLKSWRIFRRTRVGALRGRCFLAILPD